MLAKRLDELPGFASATTVLLYVTAFPEEVRTHGMLERALGLGKRLACPRVDRRSRRLRLLAIRQIDRDLVPGAFGIPEPGAECPELEPESIDWVLVPGVAFDAHGYRLGRGAGYYDRLLPTLRAGVSRWALALEAQCVPGLPVEPHDQPIDGVATATRLIVASREV